MAYFRKHHLIIPKYLSFYQLPFSNITFIMMILSRIILKFTHKKLATYALWPLSIKDFFLLHNLTKKNVKGGHLQRSVRFLKQKESIRFTSETFSGVKKQHLIERIF